MEFKLIRIIFALFSVQNLFAIAASQAANQQGAVGSATTTTAKKGWIYESEDRFCIPRQNRPPFTRSTLDGAVCCKGTVLQAATVLPEVTGECAMKSKTDENGMLHPAPLVIAYFYPNCLVIFGKIHPSWIVLMACFAVVFLHLFPQKTRFRKWIQLFCNHLYPLRENFQKNTWNFRLTRPGMSSLPNFSTISPKFWVQKRKSRWKP